eukprot:EG_transcript_25834
MAEDDKQKMDFVRHWIDCQVCPPTPPSVLSGHSGLAGHPRSGHASLAAGEAAGHKGTSITGSRSASGSRLLHAGILDPQRLAEEVSSVLQSESATPSRYTASRGPPRGRVAAKLQQALRHARCHSDEPQECSAEDCYPPHTKHSKSDTSHAQRGIFGMGSLPGIAGFDPSAGGH